MKKIISLLLVMMLLFTSVFTGFAVSAEDTATETVTTYVDELGLTIDDSMFPGIYYAGSPHYENNDAEQGRNINTSIFPVFGNNGKWVSAELRTKWVPSVALNAGQTGEGDNALRAGIKGASYVHNPLNFMMRTYPGDSLTISKSKAGTYTIKFDVKLVYGEISNIYAGFYKTLPGKTNRNNPTQLDCDFIDGADSTVNYVIYDADGNTDGYSGDEITSEGWTTLTYTTTVSTDIYYFYINLVSNNADGGVVLIDNIAILNEKNENVFISDNVSVARYSETKTEESGYYQYTIPYANIGNFDDSDIAYDSLGLNIANNLVPGYYYYNNPHYLNDDSSQGRVWSNTFIQSMSGASWTGTSYRVPWLPSIALNAGPDGTNDNALRYGVKGQSISQYPIQFMLRNANDNFSIPSKGTYTIKLDVKLVHGTLDKLYAGLYHTNPTRDKNGNTSTTCEFVDGNDSTVTRKIYNNNGDTTGYTGEDIATDKWTTLTYTITSDYNIQFLFINMVSSDSTGCVLLIDNIQLLDEDGTDLFVSTNVCVNRKSHVYQYPFEYYSVGNFNSTAIDFDNTVDPSVKYIPASKVGLRESSEPVPTLALGEGVKGSTAVELGMNTKNVGFIHFQSYDRQQGGLLYNTDYIIEFKAKLKAGTLSEIKVGFSENGFYDMTSEQLAEGGKYASLAGDPRLVEDENGTFDWASFDYYTFGANALEVTDEWACFRGKISSYNNEYNWRRLVISVIGADAECVVLLDDIKVYYADTGELVGFDDENDPNGSFDEMAIPYNMNSEQNIAMSKITRTASEFIELLNLNVNYKNDVMNNTYGIYRGEEKLADDAVIATGDVFKIILKSDGSEYRTIEIAVKNDVNCDGVADIRDVVRAKKGVAKTVELSDAQLMAASVAEGNEITISEVVALRDEFLK